MLWTIATPLSEVTPPQALIILGLNFGLAALLTVENADIQMVSLIDANCLQFNNKVYLCSVILFKIKFNLPND